MALLLASAAGFTGSGRNECPFDAEMIEYYQDLLALFDVPFDEQRLRTGPNVGYTELAESVLAVDGLTVRRPDLVLLTYAIPDLHPFKAVSAHVNHLLGGGARSMAISEQGLQAPYTALQLADAYHRSGGCDSALVLVVEQTTLPYHDPLVQKTPLSESAVALALEAADAPQDRLMPTRPWAGPPAQLRQALSQRCAGSTLVVAGPWVKPEWVDGLADLYRCPTGTYCTSVWLALAEQHHHWSEQYATVLVCDMDPRTATTHAMALTCDPAASRGAPVQSRATVSEVLV